MVSWWTMGHLHAMRNPLQHYAWGTHDTLARMRGVAHPTQQPEAELWVGAHPSAPSQLVEGEPGNQRHLPLDEAVARAPQEFLPEDTHEFPFLLKILAIGAPLSLQVHPSEAQAQEGFEREEAAGVPREAAHRNYKDRHSKPETVIAVSPVRILTGIRPTEQLREIAEALDLRWLAQVCELDAAQLVARIFQADDAAAARDLQVTVAAARTWAAAHPFDPRPSAARDGATESPEARLDALADLIVRLDEAYPGDRGILVATAMNQLFLAPGEAAHTPDGQVHAYISGTAVEIMNPSDNVMRAGLTPKHIDVEQMLSVLVPEQPAPPVQTPVRTAPGVFEYSTWDPRLSVLRLDVSADEPLEVSLDGLCAVLCTDGRLRITPLAAEAPASEAASAPAQTTAEVPAPDFGLTGTQAVLHTGTPDAVRITGSGRLYCARWI